jgi:hypothetical protein
MGQRMTLDIIAHHYGFENQREQLIEELAECILAAQKCKRNIPGSFRNFLEELADSYIMVIQMIHLSGVEEVEKIINEKINRQLDRIAKENEENGNEAQK